MAKAGRYLFAFVLALVAVALLSGGVQLLTLRGSPYYLLAGLAAGVAAVLLLRGSPKAVMVYAALLLATAAWSLWESGLDRWALVARLIAPAVLGLPFLLPGLRGRGCQPFVASLAAPSVIAAVAVLFAVQPIVTRQAPGPAAAGPSPASAAGNDWATWGADPGGTRFSSLADLTPQTVSQLKVAWTYRMGVPKDGRLGNLEVTPLKIGNRLYVCNNMNMVDALDPETGRRLWRFDPKADVGPAMQRACRGVAFYASPGSACPERIITATFDAKLWTLDAATGRPCADFGKGGVVDLSKGMGPIDFGYYYVTSAPTIVRGKIVVGGWVMDGQHTKSPPGVIRAYDAVSGAFAWAWDMERPDDHGEPAEGQTYTLGSPNSWAPMSADEKLGLVYLPTGNATPDYYGAQRSPAFDRYSSSVVALDAATGDVRWSFQTTHHDLWDYDVSSQPTLVDLPSKGGVIPALIQPTKRGELFLLDRLNGKPLAQVTEVPVRHDGAPGERVSPTQPFSTGMPSVAGPRLTEARMWGMTPLDQLWCRIAFKEARYDGPMTPPQVNRTTIQAPGFMGAVSWGGVSVDTRRGLMIVNSTRLPTRHYLIPRAVIDGMGVKARGVPGGVPVPGHWAQAGTPYGGFGQGFLSPLGAPCLQPPYGVLTAIDLNSRRVVWETPLGTAGDSGPAGLRFGPPLTMGVPNTGGSVVTAGGLTFIGSTQEQAIRAVDVSTGKVVWKDRLPAGGQASPMTYRSAASGRQFVVIAAGGKMLLQTRLGDYLVAYAVPKD